MNAAPNYFKQPEQPSHEQSHSNIPAKKAPAQPAGFSQQCRAVRSHHGFGRVWGQHFGSTREIVSHPHAAERVLDEIQQVLQREYSVGSAGQAGGAG